MKTLDKKFRGLFLAAAFIVLVAGILMSLKLGSINITFEELIRGLFLGQADGNIGIIKDLRMLLLL